MNPISSHLEDLTGLTATTPLNGRQGRKGCDAASVNQPTDSRMMTPAAREISIYPSNMARIMAPLSGHGRNAMLALIHGPCGTLSGTICSASVPKRSKIRIDRKRKGDAMGFGIGGGQIYTSCMAAMNDLQGRNSAPW